MNDTLKVAIGKTLNVTDDEGNPKTVTVETIAHSFKYPDRAVINETYFINVFDLFSQIYGEEDMDEEEWADLKAKFKGLSAEEKRFVLAVGKMNENEEF